MEYYRLENFRMEIVAREPTVACTVMTADMVDADGAVVGTVEIDFPATIKWRRALEEAVGG